MPAKKGRPKKRGAIKRFTVEFPVKLVRDLDKEADKLGVSRTYLMIKKLTE